MVDPAGRPSARTTRIAFEPATRATSAVPHQAVATVGPEPRPMVAMVQPDLPPARAAPRHPGATREALAHARHLGLGVDEKTNGNDVFAAVRAGELQIGHRLDGRVSSTDMARAVDRAKRAAQMVAEPQVDLYAFTRLIDAKVTITPALVDALVEGCTAKPSGPDMLFHALDQGPGQGGTAWPHPGGRVELVASIIRHLVLGKGASLQLQLDPPLAAFLEEAIASSGTSRSEAMGGAGAFGANLAATQANVASRFFSKDPLPKRVAERFGATVDVVGGDGAARPASKAAGDVPARVNTSAEYSAGTALRVAGRSAAKIDGKVVPLVASGDGRIIMGTKAGDLVPGFAGVSDATLARLGQEHDLFFFVGTHYFTAAAPSQAKARADELAAALGKMKHANPRLVRHLQYVVPKVPANEVVVLRALVGQVDSTSLNSVEAPALVARLGERPTPQTTSADRDLAERPAHMLANAEAILASLAVGRVHLHGLEGDLVVVDEKKLGPVDLERQALALARARQLASAKAANPSGEIRSPDEAWSPDPVVKGSGLAALHAFADELAARFGLDAEARQKIVEDWGFRDVGSGRAYLFAPSRGIFDRAGGTVSLGDTIDATALIYGLKTGRAALKHPRAYFSKTSTP